MGGQPPLDGEGDQREPATGPDEEARDDRARPVPIDWKTTVEMSSLPSRGRSCQKERRGGRSEVVVEASVAVTRCSLPGTTDTGRQDFLARRVLRYPARRRIRIVA